MRELAILYLGAFAPDRPEYINAATSTAGTIFQTGFLDALVASDLPDPEVRCYYPVASFPRSRSLVHLPRTDILANGLKVRSLAHFNLGVLKILTLGITSAWATFVWGVRHRSCRRVVVSYNLNAPPACFIAPVCKWLRMKYVPFIGDIYVPGDVTKDSVLRRIEFGVQRRAVKKADGLLVCNKSIVADFAPESDYLLIEGGVPAGLITDAARHSGEDKRFRIVFAGQLSELNGVTLLLDAMKLVGDQDLTVTIMGGGALEETVRRESALDPRISFLGLVSHEKVLLEYASADLLVNLRSTLFQSHRYVFPSKVLECLATGVPLLSTKTGHVESEFGEFVFLLEKQEPSLLAQKIVQIKDMREEDRLSIGKSAKRHVLLHKTWEAQVRKIGVYLSTRVFDGDIAA